MKILIIGLLAGALCTFSFLPQVVKIYRTKNARDLSLVTFTLLGTGVFCWLIYGLLIGQLPVILANALTLILLLPIIIMKIIYK